MSIGSPKQSSKNSTPKGKAAPAGDTKMERTAARIPSAGSTATGASGVKDYGLQQSGPSTCYKLFDIKYDTDGQKIDGLPGEIVVEVEHGSDIGECGADLISDRTGWCVESFSYEEVKDGANLGIDAAPLGEQSRFAFRAEAAVDLTRLLRKVLPEDPEFLLVRVGPVDPMGIPCGIEVECLSSLSRKRMSALIGGVEDGHVMGRTLRSGPAVEPPRLSGAPGMAPGRSGAPVADLPGRPL